MALKSLSIGFIPLLDASILIAARERGFAEAEGLSLSLLRETSWANVRDRIAVGHLDAAQMLAPMPIAANLGLTPFDAEVLVPMALGLGGNAVTLSTALAEGLSAFPPGDAAAAGAALRAHIKDTAASDAPMLRFGVVHPHSSHNLELRYWLAGCGIVPEQDVEIVILPPTLMPDALRSGQIDGYCVGEPWNTVAAQDRHGRILITKDDIWASSPEKVLGVARDKVEQEPETVSALVRACHAAAAWCGAADNHDDLAQLLSRPAYLDAAPDVIRAALAGPAAYEPFAKAATFPWVSHALWFYTQLVRWGMIEPSADAESRVTGTYRPDLYRRALDGTGAVLPAANAKVEGALEVAEYAGAAGGSLLLGPDGFFDGKRFDPDDVSGYIAGQKLPG
ncbi:MAG: ABC transporter substrate-binding protein [Pseudomonadota bacterium]